jgi:hypothetical protein
LGAALQADGETRSVVTASSIRKEKRSMDYFAGLDVSVKETSVTDIRKWANVIRIAHIRME